jgi:transposase-like protein
MGKKNTERRVYTKEFKAEAAALAEKREKPVSRIATDLGINENMLRRWMQASRQTAGSGLQAFPGHGKRSLPACGKRTRHCVYDKSQAVSKEFSSFQ